MSEEMTPQDNFTFINSYMACMNPVIARHRGMIDKYVGDAIMALFPRNADDAVRCGIDMLRQLVSYNRSNKIAGGMPVKIGIGLNTGLMMLGIIGGEHFMETTVISDAVNLASRIESMTKDYDVRLLISEHTYDGLQDASAYHVRFIDRVKVKGKSQCQSVYEVFDADPQPLRQGKQKTKVIFEEALASYHLKEVSKARRLLRKCLYEVPNDTVAGIYLNRCDHFLKTGIHESSGEFDFKISWNSSLMVDGSTIDQQHRQLFDHARNFVEAVRHGEEYAQLQELLRFLDEYIKIHFHTEERMMAEKKYPFLSLQVEQHRRFSHYFKVLKNEIKKGFCRHRVFLLFRVQILIIDWLINHIGKFDRHFGKFLREQNLISCTR